MTYDMFCNVFVYVYESELFLNGTNAGRTRVLPQDRSSRKQRVMLLFSCSEEILVFRLQSWISYCKKWNKYWIVLQWINNSVPCKAPFFIIIPVLYIIIKDGLNCFNNVYMSYQLNCRFHCHIRHWSCLTVYLIFLINCRKHACQCCPDK